MMAMFEKIIQPFIYEPDGPLRSNEKDDRYNNTWAESDEPGIKLIVKFGDVHSLFLSKKLCQRIVFTGL
jgi:hypothetical protein